MATSFLSPRGYVHDLWQPTGCGAAPSLSIALRSPKLRKRHHRAPVLARAAQTGGASSASGDLQQHRTQKAPTCNGVQALPASHAASTDYSTTLIERPFIDELAAHEAFPTFLRPSIDEVVHKVKHHDEEEMQELIKTIKGMFQTMSFGEISISAYDTAWVAMVPCLSGSKAPQFPKCLKWIVENQLKDGSWGDKELFLAYDRVCSTVACLVALKTWNTGHENIEKGVKFVQDNMSKLSQEMTDYMPIGFEVVFPTMLDDAKSLGLHLPYDSPIVQKIRHEQKKKLKRIPMEILHSQPTSLLHSLEGLHREVDWKKILNLQSKNGSFLFSPASTACALRYTGDKKCLEYLTSILGKFHNAVPNVYPVDLFEHLWVIDRLERLGISRYFDKEIKQCLNYVFKYWKNEGIAWASESEVSDVDDTAMGFRLLRTHGYSISPDVFKRFQNGGEFFGFEGQTSQALTGMYNLYRASQTMLPGETILEEAHAFTKTFLVSCQKKNKIHDKWIISRGLKGEVEYSLSSPWCESLPRVEARSYIEHYGVDDIWIGKSLYKMYFVNNKEFLKLAILDYNFCQSFHQKELFQLYRWYNQSKLEQVQSTPQDPMESFFAISSSLFEPQYSLARNVWVMCTILATTIKTFFNSKRSKDDLNQLLAAIESWDPKKSKDLAQDIKIIFLALYNTIDNISNMASATQGHEVGLHLRSIWTRFLSSLSTRLQWRIHCDTPTLKDYMHNAKSSSILEPILTCTIYFLHETIHVEDFQRAPFPHLVDMLTTIGTIKDDIQKFHVEGAKQLTCVALYLRENSQQSESQAIENFLHLHEEKMRIVVKEYLGSTQVPSKCKHLLFHVAKIINFIYNKANGIMSTHQICSHYSNLTLFTPVPHNSKDGLDVVL